MTTEVKCWCRHCGKELEPSHTGKCPYCGKTGKDCKVTIHATVGIKASVSATRTRVFFEWHKKEINAVIVGIVVDTILAAGSTLIGLFVGGILGAIIGFAVAFFIILLLHTLFKRRVKTLVREITKYQ